MRIFLALLLAGLAGATGWYLGSTSAAPATNSAEAEAAMIARAATRIRGLGKLEPASGIIKILAPQGQKIETLFGLKVGDPVKFNQPLVQLNGRKARELELNIAKAKKKDALNQLLLEKSKGQLKKSSAQIALEQAASLSDQIKSKSGQIELLHRQRAAAKQQLSRLQNLDANPLTANMVGDSDLVKQRLILEQLDAKIQDAESEVQSGLAQADRAQQAAYNDLKTVELLLSDAKKSVPFETLDAAINAAQTAYDLTEIKSPIDGVVLDIVVRPGDSVTNQPVMVIGNTIEVVCVTEINDVNFRFVTVGDKATISSIALDKELSGTVESKGIMIGPPSMKDPNPFASVDRKTGRIVVKLADNEIAKAFINLQVDVEIEIGKDSESSD